MSPLKDTRVFRAFLLTWMDKVLVDFYSQMLWGLLFLALVLQPGEPGWGRDALLLRGHFGNIQLNSKPPHMGVGLDCFASLLSPTNFHVASLYP